jgi:hypothetical protein
LKLSVIGTDGVWYFGPTVQPAISSASVPAMQRRADIT